MKNIKIQVLGSGCPTCKTLHSNVTNVAAEISPELTVEYIADITKIVELGAMSSPVFAINDIIITAGKMPNDDTIKEAILEKINL